MRKKAELLGLWVACKTPSLSNTGVFCLVANRRYQAPKSATHRLGWLWNSNAYAIRRPSGNYRLRGPGLRKISELAWARAAAISQRITKCPKPVTVARETAPFMRLWNAIIRASTGAWRAVPTPPQPRAPRRFVPKLLRFGERQEHFVTRPSKSATRRQKSRGANAANPARIACTPRAAGTLRAPNACVISRHAICTSGGETCDSIIRPQVSRVMLQTLRTPRPCPPKTACGDSAVQVSGNVTERKGPRNED
jgi:hypothetical protein